MRPGRGKPGRLMGSQGQDAMIPQVILLAAQTDLNPIMELFGYLFWPALIIALGCIPSSR